ncbi:hypothetical protein Hdeb2414_s0011g00374441 [Helianthus debilis subsp. tardiflorus]
MLWRSKSNQIQSVDPSCGSRNYLKKGSTHSVHIKKPMDQLIFFSFSNGAPGGTHGEEWV